MNIKKLTYLLLLIPALSFGQGKLNVIVIPYTPTSGKVTWSVDIDDLTTSSNLGGQGLFVTREGTLRVNSEGGYNVINPANSAAFSACYYNLTLANDQFCAGTITALDQWAWVGPGVRWSTTANTGYYVYSSTAETALVRRVDGVDTELATGDVISTNDELELRIVGYELQVYVNGSLHTSLDTDGKYTDSSGDKIASGYNAIIGMGNSTSADMIDPEGGAL